jgi:F0F1-type ATP synthase membrane subunit c/vacuolar-type H+-ATPase subunit K
MPPPDIQYAPMKKKSHWFRKYGGLLVAGVFLTLATGAGVVAGLSYGKYQKLLHPPRPPPPFLPFFNAAEINKAKTTFIIWTSVASVLLLIGLVFAFINIQKLTA